MRRWRSKFVEDGMTGVGRIRPGRRSKPEIPQELVESIAADTPGTTPPDATRWSTRSMAEHAGVGKDTVGRIWRARHIRPHRVETFKLSHDPAFEAKLVDVVGLYMNPPERAVVLCCRREVPVPSPAADPAVVPLTRLHRQLRTRRGSPQVH